MQIIRSILCAFAAVATAAFVPSAAAHSDGGYEGFDPSQPDLIELTDGVYQYFHWFSTSLIVITDEGVIITDPSNALRAAAMREEIRKLTDAPVVKVIYSHDHLDHSRGGRIFKDEGAEFIAHEKCLPLLRRDIGELPPTPFPVPPNMDNSLILPDTTYRDKMSVHVGGKQVDLHYYGPNDGDCMSVIHMPEDKVLVGVDWHYQGTMLEPGRLHAHNFVGVLRTLERVRAELEFDHVISGHMPRSSPEQFEEDYRFDRALFDAVMAGLHDGKTPEELAETLEFPEFSHWVNYEEYLPDHILRMAYSIWHGN